MRLGMGPSCEDHITGRSTVGYLISAAQLRVVFGCKCFRSGDEGSLGILTERRRRFGP
jgi:hypothetical protein